MYTARNCKGLSKEQLTFFSKKEIVLSINITD